MTLETEKQNVDFNGGANGTDPWSDKTWHAFDDDAFTFNPNDQSEMESNFLETTSQASGASFMFSNSTNLFRDKSKPKNEGMVQVAIHEQISALYDGVTDEPACHVEGSIYVQPSSDLQAKPFLLVLRDLENHVANWKDWPSTCQNVSDRVPRKGLHQTDRVLQITTRADDGMSPRSVAEEALIAQYICTERVRPVPLVRIVMT